MTTEPKQFPHFKVTHRAIADNPLFRNVKRVEMDGQVLRGVMAIDVHHDAKEPTYVVVTFIGTFEEIEQAEGDGRDVR